MILRNRYTAEKNAAQKNKNRAITTQMAAPLSHSLLFFGRGKLFLFLLVISLRFLPNPQVSELNSPIPHIFPQGRFRYYHIITIDNGCWLWHDCEWKHSHKPIGYYILIGKQIHRSTTLIWLRKNSMSNFSASKASVITSMVHQFF